MQCPNLFSTEFFRNEGRDVLTQRRVEERECPGIRIDHAFISVFNGHRADGSIDAAMQRLHQVGFGLLQERIGLGPEGKTFLHTPFQVGLTLQEDGFRKLLLSLQIFLKTTAEVLLIVARFAFVFPAQTLELRNGLRVFRHAFEQLPVAAISVTGRHRERIFHAFGRYIRLLGGGRGGKHGKEARHHRRKEEKDRISHGLYGWNSAFMMSVVKVRAYGFRVDATLAKRHHDMTAKLQTFRHTAKF